MKYYTDSALPSSRAIYLKNSFIINIMDNLYNAVLHYDYNSKIVALYQDTNDESCLNNYYVGSLCIDKNDVSLFDFSNIKKLTLKGDVCEKLSKLKLTDNIKELLILSQLIGIFNYDIEYPKNLKRLTLCHPDYIKHVELPDTLEYLDIIINFTNRDILDNLPNNLNTLVLRFQTDDIDIKFSLEFNAVFKELNFPSSLQKIILIVYGFFHTDDEKKEYYNNHNLNNHKLPFGCDVKYYFIKEGYHINYTNYYNGSYTLLNHFEYINDEIVHRDITHFI